MSNLVGDKNVAQLEQNANPKAAQGPMGAYEKPQLICYGDVRDITLGPSPGLGESGAILVPLRVPG